MFGKKQESAKKNAEWLPIPPSQLSWKPLTVFPQKDEHYWRLRREARAAIRNLNAHTEYEKLWALTRFINGSIRRDKIKTEDQGEGSLMRAAKSREGVGFHLSGLLCMLLRDEHIKADFMYGTRVPYSEDTFYKYHGKSPEELHRDETAHTWVRAQVSGIMVLADPNECSIFHYKEAAIRGYMAEQTYYNAESRDKSVSPKDLSQSLRR
jgi:hypothetical protein